MFSSITLYLLCAGGLSAAQRTTENESGPSVTIESGPLIGKETDYPGSQLKTVHQYLGIPFAKPPTGDLRFSPPQPIKPWNSAHRATSQPPACLQYFGPPSPARVEGELLFNTPPADSESEDCLYLNVYTPASGGNKSVLFWIFGGSGIFGSAALPLYDGTSFAANQDIIVVAPNYRVNLFGYPSSSKLPLEERNLALLDIRLALEWTRKNIATFGGDPDKVTIAGESAGAVAAGELINTYPDNPPFQGAILQSGSALVIPTLPGHGEEIWDDLVSLLNCTSENDIDCVRAIPADTIQENLQSNALVFNKIYRDNVTQLENTGAAWARGNVAKIPIMIGSTADEGSYPARDLGNDANAAIDNAFAEDNDTSTLLKALYSPDSPATAGLTNGSEIISQILTDYYFRCTSGFVANATSNLLDMPVWQYMFDALVPSNTFEQYPHLGAWHASEIALVFGTFSNETSNGAERRLSQSMQKQWADFVKNPSQGPGWEQWPKVAVLGVDDTGPVTTIEDVQELDAVCAQWDLVYCTMAPEVCSGGVSRLGEDSSADNSTDATDQETSSALRVMSEAPWHLLAGLVALAVAFR